MSWPANADRFAQASSRLAVAAPGAPPSLRALVARLLANRAASSDALLIVADALDEIAQEMLLGGRRQCAAHVNDLAGHLRRDAPARARPPGRNLDPTAENCP